MDGSKDHEIHFNVIDLATALGSLREAENYFHKLIPVESEKKLPHHYPF